MAGPDLGKKSGGPNFGDPSSGGPSGESSNGGPSGGPSLGGPSSGSTTTESIPATVVKKPRKKSVKKISTTSPADLNLLLNRIFPITNRICKGLNVLFVRTYKRKFTQSTPQLLLHLLVKKALQGQIAYVDDMITSIFKGTDPVSQSLNPRKSYGDRKGNVNEYGVSDYSYLRLRNILETELQRFTSAKVDLKPILFAALKTHEDQRIVGRSAFWLLLMSGLELDLLFDQLPNADSLDILQQLVSPLLKSIDIFQRFLGFFLTFIYYYYQGFQQYFKLSNVVHPMPNQSATGYNLANWLRYRYNITRYEYIQYERFLPYFFRTFGYIHGRVPDARKNAYRSAVQHAITETTLLITQYPNITVDIPQINFRSILIYFDKMLENELILQEVDALGNVINQPGFFFKAADIVQWLLQLEKNVDTFSDLTYFKVKRKVYRLDLDMFEFILPGIRNVNEKGERVIVPWF